MQRAFFSATKQVIVDLIPMVDEHHGDEEGMKLSTYGGEDYGYIFEVAIADAKAEGDLSQMIVCVSNSSSKIDKVLELHPAYQWMWMGHRQNLTIHSFHNLTRNEELDNFVGPLI